MGDHVGITKTRPSNADLVENLNQLHRCIDNRANATDARLSSIDARLTEGEKTFAYIRGSLDAMRAAMGVHPPAMTESEAAPEPPPIRKVAPLGLWGTGRAVWVWAAAAAGGAAAYRVIWEVGKAAVLALHHALLNLS